MSTLHVFILTDGAEEAESLVSSVKGQGIDLSARWVQTEAELLVHLDASVDLVLAAHDCKRIAVADALHHIKERALDIPVVVVGLGISDDAAIAYLRQGVAEVLHRERLTWLGEALRRVLTDQERRRQQTTTEERLRESERRYRAVSELTSDYAYAFAVAPDGRLQCEWVTEAFASITGMEPRELVARDGWSALVHPEDRMVFQRHLAALLEGRADVATYRIITRNASTRALQDHARPEVDGEDRVIRIVGAAQDITDRRRAEEALEHLALHDPLTDLPNRTLLNDRLQQAVLSARREQKPFALLVLDLDHFKEVNDSLGHTTGDRLLQQVGQRFRSALRASDTVGRLGGDEFAVVAPTADGAVAELVAAKLLTALSSPFSVDGHELGISASIGIAVYPRHGEDGETLLRHADTAMYQAKNSRNSFAVYDQAEDQHTPTRIGLVAELRSAPEQGLLALRYQPRVAMATRRTMSVEALLHWDHPQLGVLGPDQFLPLAEQAGLVKGLSRWAVEAALRQSRDWRAVGAALVVGVNISAANVLDPEFPDTILDMLAVAGVPPGALLLEIPEHSLVSDQERVLAGLSRLAGIGVSLAIDGFGGGLSSLGLLARVPAHQVHIDSGLVARMVGDARTVAVVRSIVHLAHELGMRAVAAGVEDAAVWELVSQVGCDEAQGPYLAPGLPPLDLLGRLAGLSWNA